jgi:hypothetical protein
MTGIGNTKHVVSNHASINKQENMNLLYSIDRNEELALIGNSNNKIDFVEDQIEELLFKNPKIFK